MGYTLDPRDVGRTDDQGRPQDEMVAVTLPRIAWRTMYNQLRNQADDWGKDGHNRFMVDQCNALAASIREQVLD